MEEAKMGNATLCLEVLSSFSVFGSGLPEAESKEKESSGCRAQ
jgi:hypothetical protein